MRKPYVVNDKTSHGFYRLLDEIDMCLQNRLMLPALFSALTIPDICGKILYPKANVGFRYIAWYDEFQGQYDIRDVIGDGSVSRKFNNYITDMKSLYKKSNVGKFPNWPIDYKLGSFTGVFGQAVYALRCCLLHSADMNTCGYDDRYDFKFTACDVISLDVIYGCFDIVEEMPNGRVVCYINIDRFCKCIIRNSLAFFLEHFDDFKNIDMGVCSLTYSYLSVMLNPNRGEVCRSFTYFDEDKL